MCIFVKIHEHSKHGKCMNEVSVNTGIQSPMLTDILVIIFLYLYITEINLIFSYL